MPQSCSQHPETSVGHYAWGQGAGTWGLESEPGEGTTFDHEETV